MPKSHYYTLIVTPENLVPLCKDCNYEKMKYMPSVPEKVLLHPYFDAIDDKIWLEATLRFKMGVLCASYNVKCPPEWSDILKSRLNNHFKVYNLGELYAKRAAQEIVEYNSCWSNEVVDEDTLLRDLQQTYIRIEKVGLNTWKAALYRALVSQFSDIRTSLKNVVRCDR
jgi:hypothetical protein